MRFLIFFCETPPKNSCATPPKTRAKSSYGTCDEARRTKSQEIIWYEL